MGSPRDRIGGPPAGLVLAIDECQGLPVAVAHDEAGGRKRRGTVTNRAQLWRLGPAV
jgi:hypothetical protein